jgi:hypothetical protein
MVLDSFNADPGWRAELARVRPGGATIIIYPEGKDLGAAVVAIDILDYDVEDTRWLDGRLFQSDRDVIMERIERSLWAAFEALEGEGDTEIPSPLQSLIDLMERRSKALGARPDVSLVRGDKDGYGEIAQALRDLAAPTAVTAEDLQRWLEEHELMEASDLLARARVERTPIDGLMRDLWDSVLDVFEVIEVDEDDRGLLVPERAIHDDDKVLERTDTGASASLRTIRIQVLQVENRVAILEDPTGRLHRGALVHVRGRGDDRDLPALYRQIRAFHHSLVAAPKTLQDVRLLLYWTAAMLDAPLCQGEVKARAMAAFQQAKQYHDTARDRLIAGVSVDAVRRMHEALRRISAAAAEIARSCGEGQLDLAVSPELPVHPDDRAEFASAQEG